MLTVFPPLIWIQRFEGVKSWERSIRKSQGRLRPSYSTVLTCDYFSWHTVTWYDSSFYGSKGFSVSITTPVRVSVVINSFSFSLWPINVQIWVRVTPVTKVWTTGTHIRNICYVWGYLLDVKQLIPFVRFYSFSLLHRVINSLRQNVLRLERNDVIHSPHTNPVKDRNPERT